MRKTGKRISEKSTEIAVDGMYMAEEEHIPSNQISTFQNTTDAWRSPKNTTTKTSL